MIAAEHKVDRGQGAGTAQVDGDPHPVVSPESSLRAMLCLWCGTHDTWVSPKV